MVVPAAEIDLDEAGVRRLLEAQHRDLAGRGLRRLDAGWDNTLWRLGDDLLVRLPRRAAAIGLAANEQRWLPELADRLPLPVPCPVRTGAPSEGFPWPWSVVPWLEGEPGDRAPLGDPVVEAGVLGRFLRALHQPAPPDAPRNPYRGVPLGHRRSLFDERLGQLDGEVDGTALRRVWQQALTAPPFAGNPLWLHGDLHPANVVLAGGRLAGVVDWGDVCAGDPATDLAAVWMLLPPHAHHAFEAAYGTLTVDTRLRAAGWAVLFGLMLLAIGLDRGEGGKPSYELVGRRTLERLLAAATGD